MSRLQVKTTKHKSKSKHRAHLIDMPDKTNSGFIIIEKLHKSTKMNMYFT